jgi:hypothetical protein
MLRRGTQSQRPKTDARQWHYGFNATEVAIS